MTCSTALCSSLQRHCLHDSCDSSGSLHEHLTQVYEGKGQTPPRRAHLMVRLRETAFNAICSQLQERDETLYVAFQQHICFRVRLFACDVCCTQQSGAA